MIPLMIPLIITTTVLAVTAAIISAAAAAAGAGVAIHGAIQAKKQSRANAKALKKRGEAAASDRRRQAQRLLGRQRAGLAKSGVQLLGTPFEVLAETAAEEELDALRLRSGFRERANREIQAGDAAFTQGIAQGTTTLLGGLGTAAIGLSSVTNSGPTTGGLGKTTQTVKSGSTAKGGF